MRGRLHAKYWRLLLALWWSLLLRWRLLWHLGTVPLQRWLGLRHGHFQWASCQPHSTSCGAAAARRRGSRHSGQQGTQLVQRSRALRAVKAKGQWWLQGAGGGQKG